MLLIFFFTFIGPCIVNIVKNNQKVAKLHDGIFYPFVRVDMYLVVIGLSLHILLYQTVVFVLYRFLFMFLYWYVTTLQTGRSRVRFPMVSLEFFSDKILPVALRPWARLSQ
jgi:hypothetical protein